MSSALTKSWAKQGNETSRWQRSPYCLVRFGEGCLTLDLPIAPLHPGDGHGECMVRRFDRPKVLRFGADMATGWQEP